MRGISIILLALLWIVATVSTACEKDAGVSSADGDSDSNSDSDSDGDTDGDSDGDTDICDEVDFTIEYSPTQLMILLDNSGSMNSGGFLQDTKWEQAQQALTTLLNNWSGSGLIDFGFDVFPDFQCSGFCCDVSHEVVSDCAQNNEAALVTLINNASAPPGEFDTPLCDGMDIFNDSSYAPDFFGGAGEKYLLVVSDGQEECNGGGYSTYCGSGPSYPGAVSIVQDLVANGINVFVVGFGSGVDATQLNVIASNGNSGLSNYLVASDQTQLQAAMDSIASSVVSCEYVIGEPDASADPDQVNFYFDDVVVGYDEDCQLGEGWTWVDDEHTIVLFCDDACNELQGGSVDVVSARFGCPTEVIE